MFRNKFDLFARFAPDTPQGGAGDDGGSSDAEEAFQRRLERSNQDGIALARQLWREVYDYRQELKAAKAEAAKLQGKTPPEGAVILTGDDAAAWETYKALGKPDEVKQGLTQASELQGKLDAMERDATLRSAAELAGYKPSVVKTLAKDDLVFEVRDVEQDGQILKVAYVKEGEIERPLTDYADENWSDFKESLGATATPQGGNALQPGTRFPAQNPAPATRKQETTKAVADSYIKNTYRRANNGSNRND